MSNEKVTTGETDNLLPDKYQDIEITPQLQWQSVQLMASTCAELGIKLKYEDKENYKILQDLFVNIFDEYLEHIAENLEAKSDTHPQGEPKTYEEYSLNPEWLAKEIAMQGAMAGPNGGGGHIHGGAEMIKRYGDYRESAARASERAQIIAEQKTEIPQCLQDCYLTESEKQRFKEMFSDPVSFMECVEIKILSNVSLLLSQVKGLPTTSDNEAGRILERLMESVEGYEGEGQRYYELRNMNFAIMLNGLLEEKFSLSLLQRDEAHKAEYTEKLIQLNNSWDEIGRTKLLWKEFSEWTCMHGWMYDQKTKLWYNDSDKEKTTSDLFGLVFLKEKEERNA